LGDHKADRHTEAGLSMKEKSSDRLQSIEDMVMEMAPDEADQLIKKRAVLRCQAPTLNLPVGEP
jgi:hypothetical protein